MHPYPPGHPRKSLNHADTAAKFRELSDGMLRAGSAQRVIDEIAKFEQCENIGALPAYLAAV